MSVERRLAAILYADVAGYSRLTTLDEEGTHRQLTRGMDIMSRGIGSAGGRIVHYAGDAVLAEFSSVVAALNCALSAQDTLGQEFPEKEDDLKLRFRIGVNLGEVMIDGNEIYGDGVNIAARLEALAQPGGVCISEEVYRQVRTRIDAEYEPMGPQALKNIAEPIICFHVASSDHAKALRVSSEGVATRRAERPAIAVLPFDNMSDDPEQEFFADGIVEDLITALAKYRSFLVIARNSTFTFKGRPVNLAEAGKALGARYIVEGSVRRAGDRVRTTAQLIDTTTGGHLWADRYDHELTDIFAVQDEITQAIALAVEPEVSVAERERARRNPPENLGAWELCQRGFWHYHHMTADHVQESHQLLGRARALDPNFAPAYYGDALAHNVEMSLGLIHDVDESVGAAMTLAVRAVALDEKDPMAQAILGAVHYHAGQHAAALDTLDRALALSPNLAFAYFVRGLTLTTSSREADAIADFEMAERLSPADPFLVGFYSLRAWAHMGLGEWDDAIAWAQKSTRFPNPGFFWPYWTLTTAYFAKGDRRSAERARSELLRLRPQASIAFLKRAMTFSNLDAQRHLFSMMIEAGIPEG
ncbi:MAG: adenylate/guanylate cyclase domain-containing protein [Pseudomonadota bacterium]